MLTAITAALAFGLTDPGKGTCPALPGFFVASWRLPMGYDIGMDQKEIDSLFASIERLKVRQAEIERIQREMAVRANEAQKAIEAQEASLRSLKSDQPK